MRVLSVTHGPSVPGGVFDEEVAARGHELSRWVVPLGGSPPPPASFDAVMVFGGSMHPDEDAAHDWLAGETAFLFGLLERDVPTIGVCLGAQLLARAAGAEVRPATEPEIGWHEIELTDLGLDDPVLGTLPERTTAFQWHHYTFDLPAGAVELARSIVCTQAFRIGPARGIQFHAEVTEAMIDAWVLEGSDELPLPPSVLRIETAARIAAWNRSGRALCAAFLEAAAGYGSTGCAGSCDHSCHEPA